MADLFNMTVMRPWDATAAGSGGTPANAVSDQPGEKWAAGSGDAVTLDLGQARTVDQVAVLYTNGGVGTSSVTITASNSADMSGAATIAAGLTLDAQAARADPGYRHFFVRFDAVAYRYWRVAAGGAMLVGRVAVGQALQVEYNPDFGSTSWGYEEAPEPDMLDGGTTILAELPAAPSFDFQITWASEAEVEDWWNASFGALQWRRRPVLVVRRPDPHNYRHSGIFWGILRLQPCVAAQFDMFEVSGKIRSML